MPNFGDSIVSVCIPVYNGEDYIEETIRSVLSQTYQNFRLIISDNCSTDNTKEIVLGFKDPRISYSRNEKNLGLVGNSNRCLELADGDYVYYIHHDDIMRPDNLERKVRILDQHPSVGFVHSDVGLINQHGKHLGLTMFDASQDYIKEGTTIFEQYILNMPIGASIFIGAVMARRECYVKVGKFNPKISDAFDSEMWMRLLLFFDVACIGEKLVDYRLHDQMTSTALTDENGLNIRGLKEHFATCSSVLYQYKNYIHNHAVLKRKVASAFSMRAVTKGVGFLLKCDLSQAFSYAKLSIYFYPLVFFQKSFWYFFLTLLLGKFKSMFSAISS